MQTSTTLQLKISATKKRLFEGFIPVHTLSVIGLSGLIAVTAVLIRLISAGGSYAVVPLEIPVLSSPINDRTAAGFKEEASRAVDRNTVAVALTPREFIFGDLAAFTTAKDDIRGKFIVPHAEGSPQVETLVQQIKLWQEDRTKRLSIRPDQLLVLIPDSRVPMNIVIQVTDLLRQTHLFQSVMLAGGLE